MAEKGTERPVKSDVPVGDEVIPVLPQPPKTGCSAEGISIGAPLKRNGRKREGINLGHQQSPSFRAARDAANQNNAPVLTFDRA